MELGYKMVALANYLETKGIFQCEKFDYFLDDMTCEYSQKKITDNSLRIARIQYSASFMIEHLMAETEILPALVNTWLMDHDPSRHEHNLPPVKILAEAIAERNATTVNVEFDVDFVEDIYITEAPNGIINFNGKTYSLVKDAIETAEDINLILGQFEVNP